MADKIFNVKSKKDPSEDEVKHEALLEIARNVVIKKYFQILIQGYNDHIIENSRPSKLDANRTLLLELHAKRESLQKMLTAAGEERKTE